MQAQTLPDGTEYFFSAFDDTRACALACTYSPETNMLTLDPGILEFLQEMGTTIASSWHGGAHNYAQNIHKSFFLFSLFLVIKKDCTVSQPGSPKLKQPIKEIDCTYKYV